MPRPESEVELLREVGRFMRRTARALEGFVAPARALRERLERTEAYRRVDGRDDAHKEAAWDLSGTIGVLLEGDLARMVEYLDWGARKARHAATVRTRRRA